MMIRNPLRALIGLSALLLGAWLSPARAADIHVPVDQPTIQAGIDAAVNGDVVIVANGTYSGAGNTNLDFGGRAITVRSSSNNPALCIIDCQGRGRGFTFQSGETAAATLSGLTIQNGYDDSWGGAIYCQSSNPTVTNCAFIGNSVGLSSDIGGGAMFNADSSPTVTNCTFKGNSAGTGGAMINVRSNAIVTNCIFTGNSALQYIGGGGILNVDSDLTVTNCTFIANSASYGGGMTNDGGSPTVTNCIFSRNSVSGAGGGMYNTDNSNSTVTNCTFTGNNASLGGGMANDSNQTVSNCIFWGDTAGEFGGYFTASSCLIQNYPGLTATPDASGNFTADPLFVRNPGTNGSADPGDLHLQFGSPAIDAGNDAVVTVPPFPANASGQPTDLDGNPRLSRAHVDLGAYEYQNLPPAVNAGGNQTVTATHSGNPATDTASVTLNGSATDPENDALTFVWTDSHNTVVGHSASLPLTLAPGTYSYTLTATDAFGASSSQGVQVTVNPAPNQAPTATSQSLSLPQNSSLGITLSGSDPEGDRLTYQVGNPAHGTLSGTAPNLTYTPNAGYAGSDSFTFTVTDAYGAVSNTATVSLIVAAVPKVTVKLTVLGEVLGVVGVVVTIQNAGSTTVTNVQITSATLIGVKATLVVPFCPFTLGAGKSADVGLAFYPLKKGQKGTLSIQGSYSGGTFCLDQSVTIP